ncbi:sensor histidine kinase [Paenibacillus sp. S-12]|uniref:sensor histidine kinase n=2 Tax=unclassified Paenibacillus TaxID=185978 RepID=UPI0025A13119|nr:sensor histidine kinase [Paenibacillus sp. S-12]
MIRIEAPREKLTGITHMTQSGVLHRLQQWMANMPPNPRRSLRLKLVLFFLASSLLPLMIQGVLSYQQSSRLLQEQFGKYGQNSVNQLQYQLDTELNQMSMIAGYIYSYLLNPYKNVISAEIPRTYSQVQDKNDLEDFLKALKRLHDRGIFIITKSGYYYGDSMLNVDVLFQQPWWQQIPADHAGEYWAGFYSPLHYRDEKDTPNQKLLGLVVPIRNQSGPLQDSKILIEMNADKLIELFRMFEEDTKSIVTVTSGSGQTIYRSSGDNTVQENDIVWKQSLQINDWTIEARLPYQYFNQPSSVIKSYTLFGLGLSGFFALVLAYLFSTRVTRRIKRIKESMNSAGAGRLKTRIQVRDEDELGSLANSFNKMIGQIEELVKEIAAKEQLKKEAELRAFHYQINPHLLFNTLNSIQWKARLQGNEDIRKMIAHLTIVLEANLDVTRELVPISKELELIDHFLQIQHVRYEGEFGYKVDIASSTMTAVIPRMSLQPLFENIFFHAFEDGYGTIALRLIDNDSDLYLTLTDNGKGMSEERRCALLQAPSDPTQRHGLGMYNVDQKFKLHFGSEYGLSIESRLGSGTTIAIRWPKKEEAPNDRQPY